MFIPWGDWGIAKSVKARDFDSRIRWFESSYPNDISTITTMTAVFAPMQLAVVMNSVMRSAHSDGLALFL